MSLAFLRDADWLNRPRAVGYGRIFLAVSVLAVVVWTALSSHGIDLYGRPLGTDFKSFWAASQLALQGRPAAAYDPRLHGAAELAMFGGRSLGYAAFFYPPLFLLVCLPLALLPYFAALVVWIRDRCSLVAGRPEAAGLARGRSGAGLPRRAVEFGARAERFPHRRVVRCWRAGVATAAGSGGDLLRLPGDQAAASAPAAGPVAAAARLENDRRSDRYGVGAVGAVARAVRHRGLDRLARGRPPCSGHVGAGAGRSRQDAERVCRNPGAGRRRDGRLRGASGGGGVCRCRAGLGAMPAGGCDGDCHVDGLGSVLATPFVLDYDLCLLALPLAWLLRQGCRDGFQPWEKLGLAASGCRCCRACWRCGSGSRSRRSCCWRCSGWCCGAACSRPGSQPMRRE